MRPKLFCLSRIRGLNLRLGVMPGPSLKHWFLPSACFWARGEGPNPAESGTATGGKSMKGKEKVKSLGVELPLFPLTSVGSFPKPDYVKEARKNFPAGHIKRKAAEDRATRYWLKVQEEFGYDVLVHGEMERGDMVAYFGEELGGFQNGDPEEPVRSYGNRFWIPPEITGKVFWRAPMTVKSWQFSQSLTSLPMKGMLTGPATIYDWSLDGFYGSRREAVADIALSLRREIEALIVAGAKIIQIDEPSLAHVWKDFPTLKKALDR